MGVGFWGFNEVSSVLFCDQITLPLLPNGSQQDFQSDTLESFLIKVFFSQRMSGDREEVDFVAVQFEGTQRNFGNPFLYAHPSVSIESIVSILFLSTSVTLANLIQTVLLIFMALVLRLILNNIDCIFIQFIYRQVMPYRDRSDPRQKAAARKYYESRKHEYLARNLSKKKAIREWVQQQKHRPCMDCGVEYPHYVMDFDHRPDEAKSCEPTRLYTLQSWHKARTEVAKCDVVCANCHRERTFGGRREIEDNPE